MRNCILALLVAIIAGNANAEEPNFDYNYLDVEYRANRMGDGGTGNGLGLERTFSFTEERFLILDFSIDRSDQYVTYGASDRGLTGTETETIGDVERMHIGIGVGQATPVASGTDVTWRALITYSRVETFVENATRLEWDVYSTDFTRLCDAGYCGERSESAPGLLIGIGIRNQASENIEFHASADFHLSDVDSDVKERFQSDYGHLDLRMGLGYAMTESTQVNFSFRKFGDLQSANLGIQFDF